MLTVQETEARSRCKSITVVGRRWFQRTYGNTYHTADIYVDGVLVHTLPVQYGYGSQYSYNAVEWLKANGYLPSDLTTFPRYYCEERGIAWVDTVTDVRRERDL